MCLILLFCRVFAYSVFYVFFEQYLYISNVAVMNSIYAGIAIFVLCVVCTRSLFGYFHQIACSRFCCGIWWHR